MATKYIVLREDELMHFGRSKRDGAKVGSGRYPAGSGERPNQWKEDSKKEQSKNNWLDQNVKGGKDKPNKSRAEVVAKSAQDAVKGTSDIVDTISGIANRGKKGKTATGLSDQELRTRINRLQMEKQYSDLTKPELSRGWQIAKDVLAVAGSVAAIAVAGTTVAANIHEMRKKD